MCSSIRTRGPTTDALKHPHTVANPPPYLTMGIWYFGSNLVPTGRRTHRFSPFPNILNLDLSLQRILDHCTCDQSLCDFAQFFRSVNYFLGINGLQAPTLPFKPSLAKRRFSGDRHFIVKNWGNLGKNLGSSKARIGTRGSNDHFVDVPIGLVGSTGLGEVL